MQYIYLLKGIFQNTYFLKRYGNNTIFSLNLHESRKLTSAWGSVSLLLLLFQSLRATKGNWPPARNKYKHLLWADPTTALLVSDLSDSASGQHGIKGRTQTKSTHFTELCAGTEAPISPASAPARPLLLAAYRWEAPTICTMARTTGEAASPSHLLNCQDQGDYMQLQAYKYFSLRFGGVRQKGGRRGVLFA